MKEIEPFDQLNKTVEADETYIGGQKHGKERGYAGNKTAVVSLVERASRVRSHVVQKVTGEALDRLLRRHVSRATPLNTDESPVYTKTGKRFPSHDAVDHRTEELRAARQV